MKRSKKILSIILIATSITIMGIRVSAHSGRTDANGGHRDNQNKSGLGSYHYHCGGHPAHLHNNGICPYASSTTTQKSKKTTTTPNQGKTTNKTTSTPTDKTQTTSTSTTQNSTSSKSSNNQNTKSNKEQTTTAATSQENKQVNIDVTEIKIKENINNIKIGESKKLEAIIEPNNATDKTITWKTSDESIATINNTGEITGKKGGTAEITASSSNGKTSTIKINVEKDITEENKNDNNISENKTGNTGNTITNTKGRKGLNPIIGIISIGALGGTGYLGYKKYKINKK